MFSLEAYNAFRRGAAWVRRTDRGLLKLTGADRATWLQGLVTNDVLALRAGERGYGAWLTPQGRMITDLWVVTAPDHLLLDVPSPLAIALRDRLDSLVFAEDVQIRHVEDAAIVEIYGRDVQSGGTAVAGNQLSGDHVFASVNDRTLGMPAAVIYVTAAWLEQLEPSLQELGGRDAGLDTLDVIRIEAGIPKFLADMDEHTIPLEAGIEDRAISFTKGCYVGQEIIVRVTTRGQGRVAKRLVGLGLVGQVGRVGLVNELSAEPITSVDGRDIGRVTSAAGSPTLGYVIALGYVHRDFVEPGTELRVGADRAMVTALPFVKMPA